MELFSWKTINGNHCRPMDDWITGFIRQWRIAGWLRIKDISIEQAYNKFAKWLFRFFIQDSPFRFSLTPNPIIHSSNNSPLANKSIHPSSYGMTLRKILTYWSAGRMPHSVRPKATAGIESRIRRNSDWSLFTMSEANPAECGDGAIA